MRVWFLIFAVSLFGCAAGEPLAKSEIPPEAKPIQNAPLPTSLGTVVARDWLAIAGDTKPVRDRALKIAQKAIDDSDHATLASLRAAQTRECKEHSPYCGVYRQLVRLKAGTKRKTQKETAADPKVARILVYLKSGKFAPVRRFDERFTNLALAQISDRAFLDSLSAKLLAQHGCSAAKLTYLVGAKLEEFLPDQQFRERIEKIYDTVGNCHERDFSERAQFRAALFHIWDKKIDLALPYLRKLQHARNDAYHVRGIYWFLKSDKISAEERKKALDTLRRHYPFQLHSLLALRGETESPFEIADDSTVSFRTKKQKQHWLNAVFRSGEALLQLGRPDLARFALARVGIPVLRTEPEFQLYYAYLLNRAGAYALKFSTLGALFQHQPSFLSRAALKLHFPERAVVNKISQNSPVDELLLYSLIRQESKFNPEARSQAGAVGLMQILPSTAKKMEEDITESQLFEPEQNIRLGAQYFRQLMDRYKGDVELALAAYNAGPDRVDDWLKRYPVTDRILFLDLIPFRETRQYVASIAGNYYWYNHVYGRTNSVAGRGFKAWDD